MRNVFPERNYSHCLTPLPLSLFSSQCTSKKIIQPTIPIGKPARAPVKMKPVATHKSSARPVTSLGGVVDRNLRAFEKVKFS